MAHLFGEMPIRRTRPEVICFDDPLKPPMTQPSFLYFAIGFIVSLMALRFLMPAPVRTRYTNGMYTLLTRVSARQGNAASKSPYAHDANATAVVQSNGAVPCRCTLIDAPGAKSNADAWKSMTDKDKEAALAALRKHIAAHPKLVVMIWAPWCGHCHAAMPKFLAATKELEAHGIHSLLINAESIPRTAWGTGANAVFKIEYFPTFCIKKNGKLEEIELLGALKGEAAVPAVLAAYGAESPAPAQETPLAEGASAEDAASTDEMLKRLF